MRITVDEIQSRVAGVIDQDQDTSNISSADYALRLKFMNMALLEWSEIYDWQASYKEYNTLTSTSTGNTSIALPTDYRKLASYPFITHTGTTTDEFPEVRPQERNRYLDSDRRVEVWGNPGDGYTLRVFGLANLPSGASIKVPYYASPQSLVSPVNVAMVPNPDYLVQRTIAYWYEVRGDGRYVAAQQKAETILRNMIEYENVFGEASTNDRVKTYEETRYSFRLGRD